jgi:hypothetical protein
MSIKKTALTVVLVLGTAVGGASAALAQSAYTTGTIASSEHAGYPTIGSPNGGGLYAYAPGYGSANVVTIPGYGSDSRTHVLRRGGER